MININKLPLVLFVSVLGTAALSSTSFGLSDWVWWVLVLLGWVLFWILFDLAAKK